MRTKQCKRCGATFTTDKQGAYMCPACSKAIKAGSVVRQRTCTICGTQFSGGPRAKYCPICRLERKKENDRTYKQQGTKRPLGSSDICQMCGAEYTVVSGRQKYCPKCAPEAVNKNVRAHKRDYAQERKESLYAHKEQMRRNNKLCVVCGKIFDSNSPSVTCSDKCAKIRKAQLQKKYDINRGRSDGSKPRLTDHQSGIPGITFHKQTKKWQLTVGGKYIGLFTSIDEARARMIETTMEDI